MRYSPRQTVSRLIQSFLLLSGIVLSFDSPVGGQQHQSHQDGVQQKIAELLQHYGSNNQFMGCVTILKDGKPIANSAVGIMGYNDGKGVESTTKTRYRIGSVTKTFTAVLINQLIDDGKLSLDDNLAKFFPKVKKADTITIDQLLRHRSGIANITNNPDYRSWNQTVQTRDQMLNRIYDLRCDFKAGEETEYSNSNFLLLGYIIEEITGKNYADVLQERITKPLNLNDTYYGKSADLKNNEARAFRFAETWLVNPETDASVPHAAGAIVSTTNDLATFMASLHEGKLVKPDSLTRMKDLKGGMGQGLQSFPFNKKMALGHSGAIDGFFCNAAYFPEDKIAIAVCGNGIVAPMNDVLLGILARTFGEPHELVKFEKVQTVDVQLEKLERYTGVYSAKDFPLKITIAVEGGELTGQATGQDAFPFSATSETEFRFEVAKIRVEFTESKPNQGFDGFNFEQGGARLKFKKEK